MNTVFYPVYRVIRKLTAPINEIVSLVPVNANILDLGCGRGLIAEEIAKTKEPSGYTGVDLCEKNIEHLQKRFSGFRFFRVDAVEFLKNCINRNDKYDCIILSDMLYLLNDELKRELIESAYTVLSSKGTMILKEAGQNIPLFVQEYISVRILHLTSGESINLREARFYEDILKKLSANYVIINARRLWYPHFIIVVKK